ncbi:MAG: 50S ribosomal protein L3 N(5)-glutamine methyltransferase [Pseudomonadaceae bacterium]|nr:50S ribosomal protein L3 N(5)-glutamine methyltransferase [Pseudomonadaceae bacterium]
MQDYTVATLIEAVYELFQSNHLSYGHGTDNAWDEAVALVLTVTGLADDESVLDQSLSSSVASRCLSVAQLRIDQRLPLAYILGETQYAGYRFKAEQGVIVPRSPIGLLLRDGLQPWLPSSVTTILDLCCGSGVLGIIAAHVFPDARVTLVDVDAQAIKLARTNVAQHKLEERVEVIQADVLQQQAFPQQFDLIITNPPYVDASDMSSLPAEYAAEPEHALAGGADGLVFIDAILEKLPLWLKPSGLLVAEVGASAPALNQKYADLPIIWPDLPMGGEGVFVLEGAALNSHTAPRLQD